MSFSVFIRQKRGLKKDGQEVQIKDPNDANRLNRYGYQHFKLVECFTVLDNIILGVEDTKHGFLEKEAARKKVMALSENYVSPVDPDAYVFLIFRSGCSKGLKY